MAIDRPGSTNQYHRLALESKWIKRLQTTAPLGINIKKSQPALIPLLDLYTYMVILVSPPFSILSFLQSRTTLSLLHCRLMS